MIQDPNTQTSDLNNNTLEEVSEQQLHAITGGCTKCEILDRAISNQIKGHDKKSANAANAFTAEHHAEKAYKLEGMRGTVKECIGAPIEAGQDCCKCYKGYYRNFKQVVG